MIREAAAQPALVLVVEDDPGCAGTFKDALEARGYRVQLAGTGAAAKALAEQRRPDAILLDVRLPDVDGLVLCSELKASTHAPIILCGATTRKWDGVLGLKLGADDFIAKPVDIYELEARLEAVLRRERQRAASAEGGEALQVGNLVVDRGRREVRLGGRLLRLTPVELNLLAALARRPQQVVSRTELAAEMRGGREAGAARAIDPHVRRLRLQLNGGPGPSPTIVSVRSVGYKLVPPSGSGATSTA